MDKPTYLFDKSLILRHVPLFSELNFFEKKLVFEAMEVVEFKSSQMIYRHGDPPDAFYCIITGRVQIFIERDGVEETLEHIHRGKYFGFISLLTGEPHSVSARAVNDTVIAKIPKDEFLAILRSIPSLAIDLSRMLSRRIKRKDLHPKSIFESTIIAVYAGKAGAADGSLYALNLSLGLKKQTRKKVVLVDAGSPDSLICGVLGIETCSGSALPQHFLNADAALKEIVRNPEGVDILRLTSSATERWEAQSLISLLTMLVNDYHYCIVNLAPYLEPEVLRTLSQSDIIHILCPADVSSLKELTQTLEVSGVWTDTEIKKKMRLILLEEPRSHGKGPNLSCEQEEAIFHQPIYATLPRREIDGSQLIRNDSGDPYSKVIRRISRQVGEVLVGLALGSGSAMGMAHIGILKVLEKEEVPIDIVSGSSIGALIGALWCLGYSAAQVEEIILKNRHKKYLFGLDDLVFPLHGLIRGRHIHRFLQKYIKEATFCDLKKPFKVVACDCLSMKQTVFDSGRLIDAVSASISIPGVFEPYKIGSHHYIDGGILNPLPTDILVEAGARKIIAVNVLPSSEDIERTRDILREQEIKESRYWPLFSRIVKISSKKVADFLEPNIFDVIVSSVQSIEYLLAQISSLSQSDVTLHPDMTAVSWFSFENAPDLISRGEQEAYLHLKEIKELVNRVD